MQVLQQIYLMVCVLKVPFAPHFPAKVIEIFSQVFVINQIWCREKNEMPLQVFSLSFHRSFFLILKDAYEKTKFLIFQ